MTSTTNDTAETWYLPASSLTDLCALPDSLPTEDPERRWIRYRDGKPHMYVTGVARRLFAGLDAISARASGSIQVTMERAGVVQISQAGDRDVDFRLTIASEGGALGPRRVVVAGHMTMHRTVGGTLSFCRHLADDPGIEEGRPSAMLYILVSSVKDDGETTFEVPAEVAMPYLEGVALQHLMAQAAFPPAADDRPRCFLYANPATLCWRDERVLLIISDDGRPVVAIADHGVIRYADQPQATREWLAIDSRPGVDWPSGIVPAAEFDGCGNIIVIPTNDEGALT